MPYKTEELYKQALQLAENESNHFIEDIISGLPCVKSVFYDHFPTEEKAKDSNQSNYLKEITQKLEQNRINTKQKIRQKLINSDKSGELIALYKLVGNEDDRKKLSQQYQDHKIDGELNITVKRVKKPPIDER